jgi:putative MFS transporter
MLFGSLMWPVLGLPMTFAVLGIAVLLAVVWMAFAAPETKGRVLDADEEEETPAAVPRAVPEQAAL